MILPDILAYNLKVVFCGTAVGTVSARQQAYYAGPGNRFWPTLHKIGLTPRQLEPTAYQSILNYGIGLTDIAKDTFGQDSSLKTHDFDAETLHNHILQYSPTVLAFNGKRAAQEYFGQNTLSYGLQSVSIADTVIFVLPSTSGAARHYWDETQWFTLSRYLTAIL